MVPVAIARVEPPMDHEENWRIEQNDHFRDPTRRSREGKWKAINVSFNTLFRHAKSRTYITQMKYIYIYIMCIIWTLSMNLTYRKWYRHTDIYSLWLSFTSKHTHTRENAYGLLYIVQMESWLAEYYVDDTVCPSFDQQAIYINLDISCEVSLSYREKKT